METNEKEIIKLNVTEKTGYYNYDRNEFENEEMLLRAYSEYMRDIQDVEDFDIDNIDIDTDEDFNEWLDSYNTYYIDAIELSINKENECGVYDDIKYYATINITDDKRMYQLYSNIYDLNYQNEEDVLIASEKWNDIIQYISNEEDEVIEYVEYDYGHNKHYHTCYPNNDDDNEIINIEFDPWNFQYNKKDKTLYCTNDMIGLTNIEEEEIPTALQVISTLYCKYGSIIGDYKILMEQYSSGELDN